MPLLSDKVRGVGQCIFFHFHMKPSRVRALSGLISHSISDYSGQLLHVQQDYFSLPLALKARTHSQHFLCSLAEYNAHAILHYF